MSGKKILLKVYTPRRTVMEREVDFVLLRAAEGDMGILPGHEPAAVLLDYGVLRAYVDKQEDGVLAVMGGFATLGDDQVVVLSPVAEPPEMIEAVLAEMERERLENRKAEERASLEIQRMEAALRHSLVKMDISAYSVLKGKDEQ